MSTIQIEILNPKAVKLIQELVELELIAINQPIESGFAKLLEKLRSKSVSPPSLEEITKEVEFVRSARHERKK